MTIGDVVCILLSILSALGLLYLATRERKTFLTREFLHPTPSKDDEHGELGAPESAPFSQDIEDESCLFARDDMRFRPYVGDDVQGFHAGQRAADVDSSSDPWSRDVDAFARETREALEKKHPMPPRPAVVHEGNQEEYARWYEDQRRVQARFDEDFTRIMAEKYPPMEHLS